MRPGSAWAAASWTCGRPPRPAGIPGARHPRSRSPRSWPDLRRAVAHEGRSVGTGVAVAGRARRSDGLVCLAADRRHRPQAELRAALQEAHLGYRAG